MLDFALLGLFCAARAFVALISQFANIFCLLQHQRKLHFYLVMT